MSGMSDGVNKIFTLEAKRGGMHIDGFKNRRAMIETLMGYTPVEEDAADIVKWLESLKAKIDDDILAIQQAWELDGHKPHICSSEEYDGSQKCQACEEWKERHPPLNATESRTERG